MIRTVLALIFAGSIVAMAEGARSAEPAADVNLIAFGDWGFGNADQKAVAAAMAKYVSQRGHFDGALLLGDNFRVNIKGVDDPKIASLFEDMYDKNVLNFPFYACYGNHDYEQNKAQIELDYARLHPESRWKFPSRYYRVDLPSGPSPLVTILMLDSDKPKMTADQWKEQIDWMHRQLSGPHAPWTICCAHHPLFSNGAHGDNGVLQTEWGSVFKQDHLDFFVCGHDHTLQHLQIPSWQTSFVISGGGGARRRSMLRDKRGLFSRAEIGFAALHFSATEANVSIVDSTDVVLHQFTRDHAGAIKVLLTSPSDKATTNPLKLLAGFDEPPKTRPSTRPATRPSTRQTQ